MNKYYFYNRDSVFFFLAVTMMLVELDHIVRSGEPYLRTRGMITSRSVNKVRHPRGGYIVINTHCCLLSGHTRKQIISLTLSFITKKIGTTCRSLSYERFLEGCSSPFMRLAGNLTAIRAWCKRRLPGIVGMRGSMVIRLRPCTN